jgi:hypothetical protein
VLVNGGRAVSIHVIELPAAIQCHATYRVPRIFQAESLFQAAKLVSRGEPLVMAFTL